MPRLSQFYGIVIGMHWNEQGHHTPHFHAEYGEDLASFSLDGSLLAGSLPARQMRLVQRWAAEHQDELAENWDRSRARQALSKIDPLA